MGLILALVGALVVGVIAFGVTWLVTGRDAGIGPAEPDGAAVPLPSSRPLAEADLARARFDTTLRGYRMGQVDAALRRAAYDIGYKDELINVLEAEVEALRDGRMDDAEALREARAGAAARPDPRPAVNGHSAGADQAWAVTLTDGPPVGDVDGAARDDAGRDHGLDSDRSLDAPDHRPDDRGATPTGVTPTGNQAAADDKAEASERAGADGDAHEGGRENAAGGTVNSANGAK